jgi:hypothetical protein
MELAALGDRPGCGRRPRRGQLPVDDRRALAAGSCGARPIAVRQLRVMIGAARLVPIVSFVWQRGRCHACAAPIDRRHVLMELGALVIGIVATPPCRAGGAGGGAVRAGCC